MNTEFMEWLKKQKYQHARSPYRKYKMRWEDVLSYKRAYPISTLSLKVRV